MHTSLPMLATLLVVSVLQFSPDAPRLEVPEPPALNLLLPGAALYVSPSRFMHEHEPGVTPRGTSSFSLLRPFGEFLASAGVQLVVGSILWAVEATALFGTAFFTAAFTNGAGVDAVLGAGTYAMIALNGAILPLLSTLPVWLIASTDLGHSYSFLWTWFSGLATYGVFWAVQFSRPNGDSGLHLVLWPTHAASWLLTALVQTLVVNLTREEWSADRPPLGALLSIHGSHMSVGAPLPVLVPDASHPGQVLPVFSLARGRF